MNFILLGYIIAWIAVIWAIAVLAFTVYEYGKLTPRQQAKIESWQTRLNLQDDNTLKQFTKTFFDSEFNSIKQLLIWIAYAEYTQDDELMNESVADLHTYIRQVAIFPKVNSRTDGQFSDPLSLFSEAIGAAFLVSWGWRASL